MSAAPRVLSVVLLCVTASVATAAFAQTGRRPPSGGGGGGSGPSSFIGTYGVTSTLIVNVAAPLDQTITRTRGGTVVVSPASGADLVFDVTSDNGDRCTLTANRAGPSRIAFLPGQRCDATDQEFGARLTVTLVRGTGTLRGTALSLDIAWTVSGVQTFMSFTGTATQVTHGRRR
jgi:hypothetical protein